MMPITFKKFFSFFSFFLLLNIVAQSQPVVIGHPADTSVCNGGRADFYVLAVNAVAFQWQENDGVGWYNIDQTITYASGYNTSILTINDANLGLDGYLYRCVVYDDQNISVLSNSAKLGVNEPPVITQHPANITVCKNEIARFSVTALNVDSYQWQESVGQGWVDLNDNAFFSGTNTSELSIFTTTGMNGFKYRCQLVNGNCPETSTSGQLNVNPTPTLQEVTGGGTYCEGGTGLEIGLGNSEIGITYQLFRNTIGTGIVFAGTGSSLNLGRFTQPGNYSVRAINGATGCSINMLNTITISINPLPSQQQLLGGGSFCEGSEAPEIFLLTSEQNVAYELFRNGLSTGINLTGSGFALSFGNISETGYYTVRAENILTGCSIQMNGNVQILKNEVPQVFAGNNQSIAAGETTILEALATGGSGNYGFNWQPSAFLLNPQSASTATIPLYQTRLFNVQAKDLISQCVSTSDSVVIFVSGGALTANIIASETVVCAGTSVSLVPSVSGGTGNYNFSWTSTPAGYTSTSSQITVNPGVTTNYHLQISDGISSVIISVTITVLQLPSVFSVTGGGNYCSGTLGRLIGLSGSEAGVTYSLFRNGQFVSSIEGVGQAISFGSYNEEGIYTSTAINSLSLCSRPMSGAVAVTILERPVANAGNNQYIEAGNSVILSGSASQGSGNYHFSWSPASLLINPNAANAASLPLFETKLFSLTVTDQVTACQSDPSDVIVFVTGNSQLSVGLTASSYSVCPGESVQLMALASGGTGNFDYSWESIPTGFQSSIYNPIVSPLETSTYIVIISDGLYTVTDSLTIQVRELPQTFTLLGGGDYCSGGMGKEIHLSGSQPQTYYNLLRNGVETGLVHLGTGDAISFGNLLQQGVYEVNAFSPGTLCSIKMSEDISIEIIELPEVNAGNDVTIEQGNAVQLSATINGGSGNYNFSWSPANALEDPTAQSTMTLPLQHSLAFHVTATDTETTCQSEPDEVVVYVSGSLLEAYASVDNSVICMNESVTLSGYATGGTGNYTFQWSSIPTGFYSWSQNTVAFPSVSTHYVLKITDGINTAIDTVFVQVNDLPQIFNVNGGGNICNGEVNLPVGLSGSQPGVNYSLRLNGSEVALLAGTGNPVVFGLFNNPGTYTVFASFGVGNCGRMMAGNALITAGGWVIANAGPDKYINIGEQTTLEGEVISSNTSFTFNWSPANKLTNPDALQPTTVGLEETTLFRLQAVPDGGGCAVSEDYTAVFVGNVTSTLQLKIYATDDVICPASQIKLFALPSGGTGNYLYSWTSEPAGFESSVFDPDVFPDVSTKYKVVVNDGISVVYDSVFIEVITTPVQFQLFGGGIYCQGSDYISLSLSGSESGVLYVLHRNGNPTGNILIGTGAALQFNGIAASGNYTVVAENPASQCTSIMSGEANVQLYEPPLVLSSPDQTILRGESTLLSAVVAQGSGLYTYQWMPSSLLINPNSLSTLTLPIQQSTVFLFSATDVESGCQSNVDSVIITVTGGQLITGILASSQQLCSGEAVVLSALTEGGTGSYSYEWKNMNGDLLGTDPTIQLLPTFSQTYYLYVNDGEQSSISEIFIQVAENPLVFEMTGGGAFCSQNEGVSVGLSNSESGLLYTLYRNYTQIVSQIEGAGGAIDFGIFSISGIYTVNASRPGFGCITLMAGSALIQQYPAPFADAGVNQSAAFGSSVQLNGIASGGTGSYIYSWEPSSLLINSSALNPQTVPLNSSALFNFTVTDQQSGCEASDQTIVFVSGGTLSVNISASDFSVCPGQLVQLTALPQGGSGDYSWSWTADPPISTHLNPILTVFPQQTTKYFVQVFDGFVLVEDSIIISVLPLPQKYEMTGGGFYCPGDLTPEIGLSGSETGVNYTLLRNGIPIGLSFSGTGNALNFGNIDAIGTFSVSGSNQNGCSSFMNGFVQVQQSPLPEVFTMLGGGSFCENEASAGIYLSGSQINVIYNLIHNNIEIVQTKSGTGQPFAFLNPMVSGNYTVEAIQAVSNCSRPMQGTVSMLVYPSPQVTIDGENSICEGDTVVLQAFGGNTYSWLTDPPVIGNILTIIPESTASYTVVATNEFDCSSTETANIEVLETPSFSLRAEPLQKRVFVEESNQVNNVTFLSGNIILQEGPSQQFFYGNTILFNDSITVEVTSPGGCKSIASLFIVDEGNRINAFSPNSDNINDRFMQGSFIRLYNLWGLEIFVGDDGWDGKYKGVFVNPGTYYYIQEIKDINGSVVRTEKGSVTLVKE
jgi:hypothetical protein